METEFNLSERIINKNPTHFGVVGGINQGYPLYHSAVLLEDVKEFIRLLKEGIDTEWKYNNFQDRGTGVLNIKLFIDKLAGDKLI